MRIERVVSVISHDKHVPARDSQFRHVVFNLLQLQLLPSRLAVDVQLAVFHLHVVAFERDDSFNEDFVVHFFSFRGSRRVEYDHVPDVWVSREPVG